MIASSKYNDVEDLDENAKLGHCLPLGYNLQYESQSTPSAN